MRNLWLFNKSIIGDFYDMKCYDFLILWIGISDLYDSSLLCINMKSFLSMICDFYEHSTLDPDVLVFPLTCDLQFWIMMISIANDY